VRRRRSVREFSEGQKKILKNTLDTAGIVRDSALIRRSNLCIILPVSLTELSGCLPSTFCPAPEVLAFWVFGLHTAKLKPMRSLSSLTLLLCIASVCVAQESGTGQSTVTVHSNLVAVPVFVNTKDGHVVFSLKADDFLLTDNGVSQLVTLEEDTDSQPLALAIVVETGGAGAGHLGDYRELDSVLDALIGNVEHHVAVIDFDSTPHLVLPFTTRTEDASKVLASLSAGDHDATILDAVAFAVAQLREQPTRYRRTILLLSETIDQDSETTLNDALRLVSDTNTAIYSFSFSSTRAAVSHEASKFSSKNPGPEHGCFSRTGADSEYEGHYSKQVLDCISQLAPPLRLATMTFLTARNSLRTNTADSLAQLTGGEFFHFHDAKDLKAGLIALSNDIPNYYVLSFQPANPVPGLHALHVSTKSHPQYETKFRREYWVDDTGRQPESTQIECQCVPDLVALPVTWAPILRAP
jgi:VWFA-related protein